MLLDLFFNSLPRHVQVSIMRRKGILVGTKKQDGRKHFIYLFYSIVTEIQYRNDDPDGEVEVLKLVYSFSGLSPYAMPQRQGRPN